jgi:hypothetical protein
MSDAQSVEETRSSLSISGELTRAVLYNNVSDTKRAIGLGSLLILPNSRLVSYTLEITDSDKLVEINNAGANSLTVPSEATVPFPIGTQVHVLQSGVGQTTIAVASGVTVNATPGFKLRTRWSSATLLKRASNTWVAIGDLVA